MRHVTPFQRNPSDLWNSLEPWIHGEVRNFIMLAINKERLHLDSTSFFPSFPALDRADDDELSRTLTV